MDDANRTGFSFGLTSGIIGTLGLMVGLHSTTDSQLVVIGGILIIAISEGFSESVSMHFSKEFENSYNKIQIWQSTISTFLGKFIFSSIFVIPVILLELHQAIVVSIMFGLYLLFVVSLIAARKRCEDPIRLITKNLIIAVVVIILTHFTGAFISATFGYI